MSSFAELAAAAARGDAVWVLEHADQVLLVGDCSAEQVGWVFYYKCDAALEQDRFVLAIASGEQALSWSQQHRDSVLEGRVRLCLSLAMVRLGRVADASRLLEGYLSGLVANPAWREFEDIARYNLAVAYRHSGRLQDAVTQYRQALDLPESRPGTHVQIRQNLAWALLLLGDADAARAQVDLVAEHVRETLSLSRLTSLWVDRAALRLVDRDLAGAKAACQMVLDALDEKSRAIHLATTYITLGRIALMENNPVEAERCAMLARGFAERAERWDLHNEGTSLLVTVREKGGAKHEESGVATAVRLLVHGRGDR